LRTAAVAQAINAIEGLCWNGQFKRDGLLAGRSATRQSSLLPRRIRAVLDSHGGSLAIHGIALASAAVQLLASPRRRKVHLTASALSLVSNKLFETRNPYGRDGADQMLGVIFGYRFITALVPDPEVSDDLFLRAVNAQVAVSYTAAGLAKAISAEWRTGTAMEMIMRTNVYGGTPLAREIVARPWLSSTLSWATIAWESSYPAIYLLSPQQARVALLGIKGFHLGIAYIMGLPRFFWAFGAAHGAVEYVIASKGASR
jgi:hypothetical protein